MKKDRQRLILELVSRQLVKTQQELQDLLEENGVHCTQSTLSRDIRTLGLVKMLEPNGVIHYVVNPLPSEDNDLKRLLNIARMAVLSVEAARNIIVIKTLPGLAGAVGSFADKLDQSDFVGSIAGNDTILLIMRDDEAAVERVLVIRELLSGKRVLP